VPVVAFKSHIGHTLGGAGAIELVLATMALRKQVIPPTAGTTRQDLEFPALNLALNASQNATIERAMITSMGFGGANACMVLERGKASVGPRPNPPRSSAASTNDESDENEPVITGVGVVFAQCIGNEAFVKLLGNRSSTVSGHAQPLAVDSIEHLLNARRARRISPFAKMMLAATTCATGDAGIEDVSSWAATAHAMLGTTHGAAGYSEDYYRQIVNEGIDAANPMLFAEGVPNVASAQLSLMLGIRGGAQTIVGTRSAGLDALAMAARRIRSGAWNRAIVGAAEEVTPLLIGAYRACHGRYAGRNSLLSTSEFICGCGAVVLVLESRRAAMEREGRIRATIEGVESRRVDASNRNAHVQVIAALCRAMPQLEGLICAATGSWIDTFETTVLSEANTLNSQPLNIVSLDGRIGDTFSVGPLAGIAAVLLCNGMPRGLASQAGTDSRVTDHHARISRFGVLAGDVGQIVLGRLRLESP
jgi:3-oxoacyl-[acyl-carrier-protein] synthase II